MLKNDLNKAARLIAGLSAEERRMLQDICGAIGQSQTRLLERAAPLMTRCLHQCRGLCCQNVQLDNIIGLWDFVFLLSTMPWMQATMERCLKNEPPLFTADCIFLKDGQGPCIFPDAVRPDVCITTFCTDATVVQREIDAVKRGFARLRWFFIRRRPLALLRF